MDWKGYNTRDGRPVPNNAINYIFIQSDKLYGVYYSYQAKTEKFKLLYNLMPQLLEEDMAEMRPITFKSRDGKW